jgi:hypothetical protein
MNCRLFITFLLLTTVRGSLFAQGNIECWIPKLYIEAKAHKSTDAGVNLIKPLQCIYFSKHKGFSGQSFGGEIKKLSLVTVGADSFKILNYKSLINLKYMEKSYVTNKLCFLRKRNDLISIYIVDEILGTTLERVDFIDRIDSYYFDNFEDASYRLSLMGSYFELNSEKNIAEFKLDGNILNSNHWVGYAFVKGSPVPYENKKYLKLLSFVSKNNTTKLFAVLLDNDSLTLFKLDSKTNKYKKTNYMYSKKKQ